MASAWVAAAVVVAVGVVAALTQEVATTPLPVLYSPVPLSRQ